MTKKTNTGNSNVVEMKPKSKSELLKTLQVFLTGDLSNISENLISRVRYAVDRPLNKVTAKDLQELCTEVSDAIRKAVRSQKAQRAEASLKPKRTGKAKSEPAQEQSKDEPAKVEKPAGKAKSTSKLKKAGVSTSAPLSPKSETPVTMFPETIEDEELGTLVRASDELHTYKELCEYLNEEKPLYFATYWNARLIKQYDYAKTFDVPCPKEFPNDLDLLVALLTCENVERVYAMSRYTEAMFSFSGEDLEPVKSKTPEGEEYEIRVSNGMEFEIYIPAE